jgi:prophage tail gpP-like protein
MADARLYVGGKIYGGWDKLTVTRSVEQMAGTFELSVSELWPQNKEPRDIPPGAKCTLKLDGETVITGYVDENEPEYNDTTHRVIVRGRDGIGDLVDCAAIHPGNWLNRNLLQIAEDLCKPFGIKVRATIDVGARFLTWGIADGETVFENLDRACRHRGVMLLSDGVGGLIIAKPSTTRLPVGLELGKNILRCRGKKSWLERYSKYIVGGHASFNQGYDPKTTVGMQGIAEDAGVNRYRPKVVVAEDTLDPNTAKIRAAYERSRRYGRSLSVTYTVAGWSFPGGLWRPDRMVSIRDPKSRINRDLYISTVQYQLDGETGSTTDITVKRPEAFSLIAIPEKDEVY